MLGQVPMARAFSLYGLFVGDFAFGLTGFCQEYSLTEKSAASTTTHPVWACSPKTLSASAGDR